MRGPATALPRRLVAVGVVVLGSVGLASCRGSSTPAAGRLTVSGRAEVTRPGEERGEVTTTRDLKIGDRVLIQQGTAEIRLGDRRLELRQASDVELQSAGAHAPVKPALMDGDLLITSGPTPFVVASAGAEVTVNGVARLSRGVALLVATYQGSAVLAGGGGSVTVPALRQASLSAAGALTPRASPLEYATADTWDQRFLADAIELGNELAARSQGFSAQLGPTEGHTAAYFRTLFPSLATEPAFDTPLLSPSRAPGETLVGAAISVVGTRGSFADRWAAVFAFRDEGAPWGLVALDQGVDRVPLLAAIEAAISRSPVTFNQGPPGTGPTIPPAPTTTTTTTPPRSTTSTTVRRPGPTTTAPPTTTTTVPSGPINTGIPLIDDTINSLVETLTGLLRSLGG